MASKLDAAGLLPTFSELELFDGALAAARKQCYFRALE
jgi:hypothetical protein